MSSVVIAGNTSGSVTLAAPDVAGTTTLTLPATSGTVLISGQPVSATTGSFSGNVTLGSSVLATPTGSAPSYTCRAWVNFKGTGTVAILGSGNVTSITDNNTGDYTVNFTTAMPDANYSYTFGKRSSTTNSSTAVVVNGTPIASAFYVATLENNNLTDASNVSIHFFR